MTKKEYNLLKATGLMWELHPDFTGNYNKDMKLLNKQPETTNKQDKQLTFDDSIGSN